MIYINQDSNGFKNISSNKFDPFLRLIIGNCIRLKKELTLIGTSTPTITITQEVKIAKALISNIYQSNYKTENNCEVKNQISV